MTSNSESAAATEIDPVPETAEIEPTAEPTPASAPRPSPATAARAMAGVPGPRPAPPVAGAPAPTAAPVEASEPVVSDSVSWGRADDEGNIWVRTADGEQPVGSYPGVGQDEAIAFFARKYDELAGQVTLLDQRLRTTELPLKEATATLEKLKAGVAEAHVVGNLAELHAGVDLVAALVEQRRQQADAAKAKARAEGRAVKERIVAEAETLSTSTSWKTAGDRLRSLVEEWKAAPRLDRKGDDELWKRFSAARSAFDKFRRTHFSALDGQREESRTAKETLVKEAESLSGSKEWGPTSSRYRDLLTAWKASGRAGRAEEDALWQRFKAAQDTFFAARNALFAERDSEQKQNLTLKEELAGQAEALLPIRDLKAAKSSLRTLQDKWEAAGHVPRNDKERMDARMRKVEQTIRDAEQDSWKASNPESRARAESATGQLRKAIDKLESQAAAARAAGRTKEAADLETALAAKREWLAATEKYVK